MIKFLLDIIASSEFCTGNLLSILKQQLGKIREMAKTS